MLKKISDSIFLFSYFIVLLLATGLLFLLTRHLFFSHTYIPLEIAEGVQFVNNPWYTYPLLIGFLATLLGSKFFLRKIPSKVLFSFFALFYLLAGIYLIVNNNGALRADAKHVYNATLAFNRGDYSSLTTLGAYMYRNPHQLGLMTLERFYTSLFPNSKFIFVMNLLFVLSSNWLLYRITAILNKSEIVVNYTIFLSFLFLPQLFFILFAYGTIPGMFFCLLSFYGFLLFRKKGSWLGFLIGAFAIGIACLLRNNYIIFALTLLAVHLLSFFKKNSWKKLLILLAVLVSILLPNKAMIHYYENLVGQKIGEGTPKIAYVTMGLRDDPNRKTLGGWYDAYNTKILKRNQFHEEKAKRMAIQDLKKLIIHFLQHPDYAFKFFYEKVISTWTEPTFQSIWTGPQTARQQYTFTSLLQSIYEGKAGYQSVYIFSLLVLFSIYLFSMISMIYQLVKRGLNRSAMQLYPVIFFLGGFFFHLVWETKSQYVYIYIFLLLPIAADGIDRLTETGQKLYTKYKNHLK